MCNAHSLTLSLSHTRAHQPRPALDPSKRKKKNMARDIQDEDAWIHLLDETCKTASHYLGNILLEITE